VALFYSSALHFEFIAASAVVTIAMAALNRWNVYRPLPYVVAGVLLWVCIHESGLHSTLAGVIIAIFTPTRPPGNLRALLAQAENILLYETKRSGEEVLRHGPSEPSIQALDTLFGRIESPADKLLRNLEPWSSYFVLPLFALANAGVTFSSEVMTGHASTFAAIMLGLVVGKPVGIIFAASLAVFTGLAIKPSAYSWRQLAGAGALGGIGFTMSLFIAAQAFPVPDDFAAAKVAIFAASLLAGTIGILILLPKGSTQTEESIPPAEFVAGSEA
jgi:NhaA family Na+:H+ antiporter